MEHMDEELLKAKRQMEQQKEKKKDDEQIQKELEQSIYDEYIEIYGEKVKFERKTVLETEKNIVSIYMPEDFELLSPEIVARAFLRGNKPKSVYENKTLPFSIGFNYTENTIPNEGIYEMQKMAEKMLINFTSKSRIFQKDKFKINDYNVAVIELVSQAIDGPLYNLMYYASIEGRLLIGFVNFAAKYVERFRPIAQEIMHSLEIKEKE